MHYDEEDNPIQNQNDDNRAEKRKHLGFIAQEVKEVMDNINVDYSAHQDHQVNSGKDVISLRHEEFIVPIIKAIQELTVLIESLEVKLNERD